MADKVVLNYPTEMVRTSCGYVPKGILLLGSVACDPNMFKEISLEALYNESPKIKKSLSPSDVGNNHSLMLRAADVKRVFLSQMKEPWAQQCIAGVEVKFQVIDLDDDDQSSFELELKKHASFVLKGNWMKNFVTRKQLKAGDDIGIAFAHGYLIFKHFPRC